MSFFAENPKLSFSFRHFLRMDPEAQVIDEAWTAISGLPADARIRVIRYLAERAATDAARNAFTNPVETKSERSEATVSASGPEEGLQGELRIGFAIFSRIGTSTPQRTRFSSRPH